ncbi:phosphate transport system regulatory protein PhoU [Cutibacterium acnes JCM 18916]|nr:phosphate transport system regulatory protein PhoU [Cutibacterium acnes JCM 18916]
MRESYHDELNATSGRILTMAELVRVAVKDATAALIGADLTTAERVISDDSKVDSLNEEIERRCFDLLARQAPVAGELRTIVAMLRMCYELARMGDLAAHVAKIARLRFPEVAVPPQVADQFVEMSKIADSMIGKAEKTLADRDAEAPNLWRLRTPRWMICDAISSVCYWATTGLTGWRAPSTPLCWAATTSVSPITPWPSVPVSSTSSLVRAPLVKTGRARTDQSAPHVGVSRRCEGFAVSQ